jgi:hypothetical protein
MGEHAVQWFDRPEHLVRDGPEHVDRPHLRRSRLGPGRRLSRDFDVTFCLPPLHEELVDPLLMLPMLVALAFAIEGTECKHSAAAAGNLCVARAVSAVYGTFFPR